MKPCEGKHEQPAHFNCGRNGSFWLCMKCGASLGGKKSLLDKEEQDAVIEFFNLLTARKSTKGESQMAKLDIAVLIGGESKQFLADLTAVVERLEKAATGITGKRAATTAAETEDEAPEEKTTVRVSKGKVTSKPAKQAAAETEDEEAFDLGAEEGSDEDEAPAVTKKDLIAACRENREAAIKVLKKLKVNSVHELKPAQYSKVLAEIGA